MNSKESQAILARDMISMIRRYSDNADVLEYLDSFAFSLFSIHGDGVANWGNIASVCEQRYYSLQQGKPIPLNTRFLDEYEKQIQPYLPKTSNNTRS